MEVVQNALNLISQSGTMGLVLVVVIYDVFYLQKKLMGIIEANTTAMTRLIEKIDTTLASRESTVNLFERRTSHGDFGTRKNEAGNRSQQ
jgi:hypothetical protein